MVTATERLGDTLGEEEKPQGQLPVPPVPSMPAHSAQPQGWGPHWANFAPCSNGNTQRPSQNLQAGLSEGNLAAAECRADAHRYHSRHLPDTWLDWGRGGSGLAAAASSGLGTGSQGPFPVAAASWEEAGAPCCSEGLPGLRGGPGWELGGYGWSGPWGICKEAFGAAPHLPCCEDLRRDDPTPRLGTKGSRETLGRDFCIPWCLGQVTGGSVPCCGTDRRFSQATDSRWGSLSFKAHRIAPGKPEDEPLHLEPWEMPARLSLPCPEPPVGLGAFP